MTLNIGLEEVPFAILEAVKARIMANRRKLQDQQQSQAGGPLDQPQRLRPSLRPKPQFIKQGASTKAWRPPRQGAVVLSDDARIAALNHVKTSTLESSTPVTYPTLEAGPQFTVPGTTSIAYSARLGGSGGHDRSSISTKIQIYSASGKATVSLDLPVAEPYPAPGNYEPQFVFIRKAIEPGFGGDFMVYRYRWVINNATMPGDYGERLNLGFLCLPIENDTFIAILLHQHTTFHNVSNIFCFPNAIVQTYYGPDNSDFANWPSAGSIAFLQDKVLNPGDGQSSFSYFSYSNERISYNSNSTYPNLDYVLESYVEKQVNERSTPKLCKAYICSNDSMREISVKGPLLSLVNDPDYFGRSTYDKDLQSPVGSVTTPAIYAALNDRIAFIDSAVIRRFPADKKPVLADVRKGFFSKTNAGAWSYGKAPQWAEWGGTVANVPAPLHGDQSKFARYTPLDEAGVAFAIQPAESTVFQHQWVWDWDDPDYCRQMCLALGFTAADLQP